MKTWILASVVLLNSAFGFGAFHPSQADLNNDGKVDIGDLAEFASAWLWESTCETAIETEMWTHYTRKTTTHYWYMFTPELSISYMFKLEGTGYTASVYDGCGGTFLGNTSESGWVVHLVTADQTYYIQVENTDQATGDFDLFILPAQE